LNQTLLGGLKKPNKDITALCRELKTELYALFTPKRYFYNLNKYEQKALQQLRRNTDIIIKKADKNSGIVVMDKTWYEQKIINMLSDPFQSQEDDSVFVKNKADLLLHTLLLEDKITEKQYKNLTKCNIKTPIFYGIPKIHKENNPLRPIVSQINGPTYKLNQYIHELLLVAEAEIPYLFKDTTAFLQIIEKYKNISSNTILVTMDVVSLYTNIPHNEAIEYICEHYSNTLHRWKHYNTRVMAIDV